MGATGTICAGALCLLPRSWIGQQPAPRQATLKDDRSISINAMYLKN